MLRDPLGLHARPAAALARLVGGLDAEVRINGADAASVLELMKLGVAGGHEVTVTATGPGAADAVEAVVAAITAGSGEEQRGSRTKAVAEPASGADAAG